MSKYIYFMTIITFLIACNHRSKQNNSTESQSSIVLPTVVDTSFLPVDSSATMIASYIASLGSDVSTKLHSWSINADALRKYLDDTTIKEINLSLAHTKQYINSGNFGVPAGYTPGALTVVITGLNNSGGTVYYRNLYTLNRAKPCPPLCTLSANSN